LVHDERRRFKVSQTMRRVLMLEEPGWGGVATMCQTLQQALGEANWQVTALPWRQTHWPTLVQAAKQHDVILASHNFGPTYCGAALKALSGKPLVSWVHGPLQDVLKEARASVLKKTWLRLLYRQVDHFVSVSRTTENSLLGFVKQLHRTQRSHVVPNAMAPMPAGQPIHVHAGHGGESGIPPLLLGYVGRLSAEKRPGLLLDTLRFLPDEAQLGIVGDGPLHRHLAHQGMDLLMQGRLHFLGKHPSGASLYTPWEMTLLTSRFEGCPMTALESLACGVPCVTLPIPALRELFDRDAPYLLARGDAPVALAEAVMTVLSLPPEQVKADMARIVARHNLPAFTQAWQEVLRAC
jgi:glycosyltransferase involved in cell wall biosynthesis